MVYEIVFWISVAVVAFGGVLSSAMIHSKTYLSKDLHASVNTDIKMVVVGCAGIIIGLHLMFFV